MSAKDLSIVEYVHLTAGNLGTPGAPVLNLALAYHPDLEPALLSGIASINQAIAPPNGHILIKNVHGPVHALGLGQETRVFTIEGEYYQSLPAPAIGTVTEKFYATFVTDNHWKGHGTFSYGGHVVKNVPIKKFG